MQTYHKRIILAWLWFIAFIVFIAILGILEPHARKLEIPPESHYRSEPYRHYRGSW